MVCSKCGTETSKGLKFCTKCGSKIIDVAPGKILLKVTGVLFIIFAVIGIISFISSIISEIGFTQSGLIFSIIIGVIVFIFYMIIGVFGLKYSKNIEKAKLLLCFAGIIILIQIISIIIESSISKQFSWISIVGFILPILFIIGAYMNLKSKGGK
jgi:peptidoglycan/LPS O-acetylase OafA/YrhL